MTQMPSTPRRVSSPASTGGAGTFFEQHVDAYWLAQLLVRGIPPVLHDCTVVEVHFQTERMGWTTDDFLIVGENGSGIRRKLAGQVKHTFTVSSTDEECKKTVQDYWRDFKNSQLFSPVTDRFVLVTLRGTNTLLEHFSGLLACARAARDATEFEARLATPGFVSAKAVKYCDEIRAIVGELEARPLSAAEILPLLRVLHVLSLDLNTATGQTEAAMKTLLALTAQEQDAAGAAEQSWNALLREVGQGMPQSSSFQRDKLPEPLRQRHSAVSTAKHRALRSLSDHSALILAGIRSTIGPDLHLPRSHLVQQLLEQLESTQVVLVAGVAGSGKSGIAKDALALLAADHFTFSFRAEEFACPHLDDALQRSQIPAHATALGAVLAAQGRKALLVESVERLLEASTRDAFTDLLTLVARDPSWRLILTCRDYSADLVRACFLETARVGHSAMVIPPLDDAELQVLEAACPSLARPLANPALCRLLRNPYVLDKALQIAWSDDRTLPENERDFRARFWQDIVRAEHHAADGMPRRRELAFVEVALRRARALMLYAPCNDLDASAVAALQADSLVVSSRESSALLAPAHDVLEDWAILRWIEEQHAIHDGSLWELSRTLGTFPALRRTYRKWVSELVERDAPSADRLFQEVLVDVDLPPQFRDDTLVSLLRSPESAAFLTRHSAELFANNKALLRRIVHLLRVACVTTPPWLETTAAHASLFYIPDGTAWACVLQLVQTNLASFTDEDHPLLLGLIEDWAKGASWQLPYPEGYQAAGAIAYWLLPAYDGYRSEDPRKRILRMIVKIPNADRDRFAGLLHGSREDEDRDRAAEDFREIIFEGLEGMPVARDMPDELVAAATDYLLCSEDDLREDWGYSSNLELEGLFGIKQGRSHDFFPASAYRGPFLLLLRQHPPKGLDFIIAVFNHSAEWYAHPRVHSEYCEPPFEMTVTFADGTSRTQWCNPRVWNLYRGTSVGPYVLQCILMALEQWLLELAEARPDQLDAVLLSILRRSDSGALTAVVASVATAFPHASGETLLVLLRSRRCIQLDHNRLVHEASAPSGLSKIMPQLNAKNKVYDAERKESDARPHRRHDLEMAIANLQLGPLAPRVRELLDWHRAQMPPLHEQSEEDRVWRLAIHRMDLRQYTVAEHQEPTPSPSSQDDVPDEEKKQYVRLDLKEPEPDVKEMVDRSASELQATSDRLGLLMWAHKVYEREEPATYDPAQWRGRLQAARAATPPAGHDSRQELGEGGPGIVAAVCVRDHWDEMTNDERNWCFDTVCSEIERTADLWNQFARVQRFNMAADRACSWVLPALLGKPLDETRRARILQDLVIALTHAIGEVRWYATWGIAKNSWAIDRVLALRCVNALAMEATLVQQAADEKRKRLRPESQVLDPYTEERRIDQMEAEAASTVRKRFLEPDGIPTDAFQALDSTRWFGASANSHILAILGQAPLEPIAVAAFQRAAATMVDWWDDDDDRRRDREGRRRERNHETEAAVSDLLEDFLLRTTPEAAATILQPILDAVDRHPREIARILQGLIGVEDRKPNTSQFWAVWMLFAERIRRAGWLAGIDDEHAEGSEIMSAVFLGSWWKDDVRHWRSLEGYGHNIDSLFEELPATSIILDDYVRFLYHIGEHSLPAAFIRIKRRLQRGDTRLMLRKGNTVFLLELLLQRFVYGRPLELKRQRELRESVLWLLDVLVENGSSAAFRMRDDFVTPMTEA